MGKPLAARTADQRPLALPDTANATPIKKSFAGLDIGSSGGYYPPDVQVGVGPSNVFEEVNVEGRIWSTAGAVQATFSLASLFGSGTDILVDPRVQYDALSGRWLTSTLDETAGSILIAASTTSNPGGTWHVYELPDGRCPDQPKIGVTDSTVVVAAEVFSPTCDPPNSAVGGKVWVLNKQELLAGSTLDYAVRDADPALGTPAAAQSMTSASTAYVAAAGGSGTTSVDLLAFTGTPPATVSETDSSPSIYSLTDPPGGAQAGTSKLVDTGDNRILDAAWQAGTLWLSANDGCIPTGDTVERSCARVMSINTATDTTSSQSEIAGVGSYIYYPALRPAQDGTLTIAFGYSSASTYPAVAVTRRFTNGTFENSSQLAASSAPILDGRFGDYFGAARDPSSPSDVWVGGETATASGWSTVIGDVGASSSPPPPPPPPSPPGAPTNVTASAGSNYTATVSWAPPASDGGHPITNYVVTPYVGSTAYAPKVVGNVTTTTFPGLFDGARFTFTVAAANAVGLGPASAHSGAVAYCLGEPAIPGTDGPDTLTGTSGDDVIAGLGGDDHINGGGGDDKICGGQGDDTIDGGDGSLDELEGDAGNDTLTGNEFAVASYLDSSKGVNVDLTAGTATGDGTDTLHGIQSVFGSQQNDKLIGNSGVNFFAGLGGDDTIDGGPGFDAVIFLGNVRADLVTGKSTGLGTPPTAEGDDGLSGIEGLAGGSGTEYDFTGNASDNILLTTSGNDVLRGGAGWDTIVSGSGNDQLFGEAGNDLLDAGAGTNTIDGGSGSDDQVSFSFLAPPTFSSGVNADLAAGRANAPGTTDSLKRVEDVSGSDFPDTLAGNGGPNALYGEGGNDSLLGRAGNDFLDGGDGFDTGKGGPGKDYCLDTETPRAGCELRKRTAADSGATTGASSRLGALLSRSLLPVRPYAPFVTHPHLDKLIESREPICGPLRHGGSTWIGPPTSIKPTGWSRVYWSAVLRRNGKPIKGGRTATAIADRVIPGIGKTDTPLWHTQGGAQYPREKRWHAGRPGVYSWTETVQIIGSPDYTVTEPAPIYWDKADKEAHSSPCRFR